MKAVANKGYNVVFKQNMCFITINNQVIAYAISEDGLYELKTTSDENVIYLSVENAYHTIDDTVINNECKNKNCIVKWHKRLGHRDFNALKQIQNENLVNGIEMKMCKHDLTCTVYSKSKLMQILYPIQSKYRSKEVLELVHTDLCGPFEINTLGGKIYFLIFVDDYSRFTFIYLLKNKDETASKIKEYVASTTNKFSKKVKSIKSDNGLEYCNQEVINFLKEQGISH